MSESKIEIEQEPQSQPNIPQIPYLVCARISGVYMNTIVKINGLKLTEKVIMDLRQLLADHNKSNINMVIILNLIKLDAD